MESLPISAEQVKRSSPPVYYNVITIEVSDDEKMTEFPLFPNDFAHVGSSDSTLGLHVAYVATNCNKLLKHRDEVRGSQRRSNHL